MSVHSFTKYQSWHWF